MEKRRANIIREKIDINFKGDPSHLYKYFVYGIWIDFDQNLVKNYRMLT